MTQRLPASPPASADAAPLVQILPLVKGARLPAAAPAQLRREVPPGYGVQEQCLPFVAATTLGCLIPSPIAFGLCPPAEVPADAHAFRSPLDRPGAPGPAEPRLFYVRDDPACGFAGNAFTFDAEGLAAATGRPPPLVEPDLSFFDRADQQDLFKLHLPYILRTPPELDTLVLPPINREVAGLRVLAGLVETDWYANPVNLVLRKPPIGQSLHLQAGDPVAQLVILPRQARRPELSVLPHHARAARDLRRGLGEWYRQHDADRSAYKRLARRQAAARSETD